MTIPRRVLTAGAYLLEFYDKQQLSDLRAWAGGSAASALRAIFLPPARTGPMRDHHARRDRLVSTSSGKRRDDLAGT